jgi:hypothetical protein
MPTLHELGLEVAEVRHWASEGGKPQSQKRLEDFERGTLRRAFWSTHNA